MLFDLEGEPFESRTAPRSEREDEGLRVDPLQLVLSALRRRWFVIGLLAAVFGAAGGYVVMKRFRPIYSAEVLIEVQPTVPLVAFTDEEWRAQSLAGFYNDHMRTITQLASSRPVMKRAVASLDEAGVSWLSESVDRRSAPDHLRSRVQVNAVRESHLFTVRFDDADAGLVAPVANAVASTLLAQIQNSREEDRAETLESIDAERARLESDLETTYAKLDALSENLGAVMLDERHNIFYERLNTLEEGVTKVYVERVRAEGELLEARLRAEELGLAIPEGELSRLIDDDTSVKNARTLYGRLVQDEERETGQLSPDHPERQQSVSRLASAIQQVQRIEEEARERISKRLTETLSESARLLVSDAEARVAGTVASETSIRAVQEEARDDLDAYGRAMFAGERLRAMADRLLESMKALDHRRDQIVVESRAPSRLSISAPAVTPLQPSQDLRKILLGAAAFGSLAAAALLAVLFELLRGCLWSSNDVRKYGLVPIEGAVDLSRRLRFELESARKGGSSGLLIIPADDSAATQNATRDLALELSGDPHSPVSCTDLADPSGSADAELLVGGPTARSFAWRPCASRATALIVVRAGRTRERAFVSTLRDLREAGARELRAVLLPAKPVRRA